MFDFDYSNTDYEQLVPQLASQLNVQVHNDQLLFPEAIGSGSFRHIHVPNGLHAYIIDCTMHQDWHIHQHKNAEDYYTLHFDELIIADKLVISIDEEKVREKTGHKALAYLTSSQHNWSYQGTNASTYKAVNILFNRQWL